MKLISRIAGVAYLLLVGMNTASAVADIKVDASLDATAKLFALVEGGVVPTMSDPDHAGLIRAACAPELTDLKGMDFEQTDGLIDVKTMLIWFQRLNQQEQIDPSNSAFADEIGICIDSMMVRTGTLIRYLYDDDFDNLPDWRNDPIRLQGFESMHNGHTMMVNGMLYVIALPTADLKWRQQRAAAVLTSIDRLGADIYPHHCRRLATEARQHLKQIDEQEAIRILSDIVDALPCR